LVPFRLDGKVLSVAMRDPMDLKAISEVSFRTGCLIKAHVAPDAQLQTSLEKFYQIPQMVRFVQSPHGGGIQEQVCHDRDPKKGSDPEAFESAIERVKRDLAYATSREEVITSMMTILSSVFDRLFFFILKKKFLRGWMGMAPGLPKNRILKMEFPLGEPSFLNDVAQTLEVTHGPLSDYEGNRRFMRMLGGQFPEEVLGVPLRIQKQVVGILYGDNLYSKLPITCVTFAELLADKAAMSLEILILRQKILD